MTMRRFFGLLVLLLVGNAWLMAQQATPWTHQQYCNNPDNFQFVIISDVNSGERAGVLAGAVEKINLLQPEFVMCIGDLIFGYKTEIDKLNREYDSVDTRLAKLQMPFYRVVGNHDITNTVMRTLYLKRYGVSYTHFVYRNVLFLCLDTEDPTPTNISDAQTAYVQQALAENPDVRWTCVFLHKPMWLDAPKGNWEKIETALAQRPHTVFAGHRHNYRKYVRNGHDYIMLATTGGGSAMRGETYGEFDHLVWVTMTADGPVLANLLLDGIRDKNIRTAETAELVDTLSQGRYVEYAATYRQAKQRAVTIPLRFVNPSTQPLRIDGTLTCNRAVTITPATVAVTVAPGEVVELPVLVTGKQATPGDVVLKLQSRESFTLPDGKTVALKKSRQFAAVEPLDCPPATTPISVDGALDEWTTLPQQFREPGEKYVERITDAWRDAADASLRFGVSHDAQYLYLGIQVTDDALIADPAVEPWFQDGLQVRLDARPDPARSLGTGANETYDFLLIPLVPGATAAQTGNTFRDRLPAGVQAVCVQTATGYNAEIAIPVRYLNAKQGGPWSAFRLNITLDDQDTADGGRSHLAWKPDWHRELNYAASGTFTRKE